MSPILAPSPAFEPLQFDLDAADSEEQACVYPLDAGFDPSHVTRTGL